MPRRKASRYRDELGKPLVRLKPVNATMALQLGYTMDELLATAKAEELRELARRFDLLFEHYSISRTADAAHDYAALARALAVEHVPGMRVIDQPPPRTGRPKVWNASSYMELLAAIEIIKKERGCGDREACKIQLQRTRATSPTHKAINALNARLTDARSPKKNWLYGFLCKDHGDDRDALVAHIIEQFGPDRK